MNKYQVVSLMESSRTAQEWDANADKVKAACGGYPSFWFPLIISSGLAARITERWNGDDKLHVTTFR